MIVVDASAMIEALVGADPQQELLEALSGDMHAPHLLDVEVTSVLRGLELGRVIMRDTADGALQDYWSFAIARYELEPLVGRVWELRHQFTSHDATYLALAEALRAPLITCDSKLATGQHRVQVLTVPTSA